jgi:hypothetical protein
LVYYTNQWLAAVQDEDTGDGSDAATNFLEETLPYLAEVVVQNGIFWIHDYPNHPISRLLLHALTNNYAHIAAKKRQWVKDEIMRHSQSAARNLSHATQQVMNGVLQGGGLPPPPPPPPFMGAGRGSPAGRGPGAGRGGPAGSARTINDALSRMAHLPAFATHTLDTVALVVQEFKANDLLRFEHADKKAWGPSTNDAYSKRLIGLREIRDLDAKIA